MCFLLPDEYKTFLTFDVKKINETSVYFVKFIVNEVKT